MHIDSILDVNTESGACVLELAGACVVEGSLQHGRSIYVAARPLAIGGPDGTSRQLEPGDVLSAEEAAHSRGALAALVGRHDVFEIPVDRGLGAALAELHDRVCRLERTIALSALSDSELLALLAERGFVETPSTFGSTV